MGKSGSTDTTSNSKKDTSTTTATAQTPPDTKSWVYTTDTDKMTSKLRYFAAIEATNKLNFDSPYEGGSTGEITLRNQNKENDVILSIDKGQFVCDLTDGCPINVRFDNDPAIKFTGSEPTDGSSTVLFIQEASKFISHAKKAKKMIVQAEFYESGSQDMEFNIDGLKWDH